MFLELSETFKNAIKQNSVIFTSTITITTPLSSLSLSPPNGATINIQSHHGDGDGDASQVVTYINNGADNVG